MGGGGGGLPAKGTLPLGLGPRLLRARRDTGGTRHVLISIHPSICLCNGMNFLEEEKGLLGDGGAGGALGDGADPVEHVCASPAWQKGSGKGWEPNLALPPQHGARLDPAEPTAPAPLPRSPALPSEEIWGFLHAVSRLQRCVNWIRWEAERDADLEELLSGARLPPV